MAGPYFPLRPHRLQTFVLTAKVHHLSKKNKTIKGVIITFGFLIGDRFLIA